MPDLPPGVELGEWIFEGEVRDQAEQAVARGGRRRGRTSRGDGSPSPVGDGDLASQLRQSVGPERARRLDGRVREAARAYSSERYTEARSTLAPIAREAPDVAAVRELLGLALYRLGRWKQAIEQLEAFRQLTGSVEQHPVLADCYRAQRRYDRVDELWTELREVSPDADLVMEGRIVAAGALADRGDLRGAIALLRKPGRLPKVLQERHLRQAYVLGDLYERVGDVPKAREWFRLVARDDGDFADVRRRLRNLT